MHHIKFENTNVEKQCPQYQTWITGPSAKGSEYGTPSSMMSEPQESSTFSASAVVARSGSPAVMYGMNATFTAERHVHHNKIKGKKHFSIEISPLLITYLIPQLILGNIIRELIR